MYYYKLLYYYDYDYDMMSMIMILIMIMIIIIIVVFAVVVKYVGDLVSPLCSWPGKLNHWSPR